MSDLTKFEELGMVAIRRGHNLNYASGGDVTLSYNRNRKEVYISMERSTFKIAFHGGDGMRILPVLDYKRGRVYLIPDETGYAIRGKYSYKNGKVDTKLNFTSVPLFVEMTKHKLSKQAHPNLLFDADLNARYISVE